MLLFALLLKMHARSQRSMLVPYHLRSTPPAIFSVLDEEDRDSVLPPAVSCRLEVVLQAVTHMA